VYVAWVCSGLEGCCYQVQFSRCQGLRLGLVSVVRSVARLKDVAELLGRSPCRENDVPAVRIVTQVPAVRLKRSALNITVLCRLISTISVTK
jgi:hypothetical protein